MSAFRNLMYALCDRERADEPQGFLDPAHWSPYLDTRSTSAERASRAIRLRIAEKNRGTGDAGLPDYLPR